MKPLNPELFDALSRVFGKVRVANHGTAAHYNKVADWFTTPLISSNNTKPKMRVDNWGETYSVCCPKCNDKRFRLYISHVWGVYNEEAGRRFYPVKCHNEGCDWSTLKKDLFTSGQKSFTIDPEAMRVAAIQRKMEYPCNPADLIPVNKLSVDHPVCQYLLSRNFGDLDKLAKEYQFCYCEDSPWKKEIKDTVNNVHIVTPSKRLIIPNIQNNVWAGWQARYIGVIPKDPKTQKPVIQKYLNAPGYSFGTSLYRLEQAKAFTNGTFCLVSEGALSAVAAGEAGICTFGMFPKPMQEDLLVEHFSKAKIIFLIESEARINGRIYQCIERLNSRITGKCIAVDLPDGHDAASMAGEELVSLINSKLQ